MTYCTLFYPRFARLVFQVVFDFCSRTRHQTVQKRKRVTGWHVASPPWLRVKPLNDGKGVRTVFYPDEQETWANKKKKHLDIVALWYTSQLQMTCQRSSWAGHDLFSMNIATTYPSTKSLGGFSVVYPLKSIPKISSPANCGTPKYIDIIRKTRVFTVCFPYDLITHLQLRGFFWPCKVRPVTYGGFRSHGTPKSSKS